MDGCVRAGHEQAGAVRTRLAKDSAGALPIQAAVRLEADHFADLAAPIVGLAAEVLGELVNRQNRVIHGILSVASNLAQCGQAILRSYEAGDRQHTVGQLPFVISSSCGLHTLWALNEVPADADLAGIA